MISHLSKLLNISFARQNRLDDPHPGLACDV